MKKKLLWLTLFSVAPSRAQPISAGVIGGMPFNDVVKNEARKLHPRVHNREFIPGSSNFALGASLQANLPSAFRFLADIHE